MRTRKRNILDHAVEAVAEQAQVANGLVNRAATAHRAEVILENDEGRDRVLFLPTQ